MARKLVGNSIQLTKTAAEHFAKGYRSKSFGRTGKPRGTVTIGRVGKYWGVFDSDPQPGTGRYMSIEQGKALGRRIWG